MEDKSTIVLNLKNNNADIEAIIMYIMNTLAENGYEPVDQLSGFLISGDPTYITSKNGARELVHRFDRDVLLEEIISYYYSGKLMQGKSK